MRDHVLERCSVEVILFDFGGVLAEEGFREGLRAIAKLNGLETESFIRTGYDLVFGSGHVVGRLDEKTFLQIMREKTGINGTDEVLRNAILSRYELRTWMLDLVRKLRDSNIRVGILSDHTRWLDELDARDHFFKWFDYVFNSYYLGKSKKDPPLFAELLAVMDVEGDQVLFVDDDQGNVDRAKGKGWHALLYKDRDSFLDQLAQFCPFVGEEFRE